MPFAAPNFDTVEAYDGSHKIALMRLPGRRKSLAAPQNALASRSSFRMPIVERREFFLPDLDPVHDGLKVAHLTDIHVGRSTPARRVLDAVAKANLFAPDLTVLTGDYLSHHERGLGLLREQFSGLRGSVVAVLGNHDHWVDPGGALSVLQSFGYAVLRNQNTTLSLRGAPFTVVGIDDLVTENHDVPAAFAGAREGSRLVLAHAPRTAELLTGFRASLCLAGHTHGGHVNLPKVTVAIMRRLREHYLAGRFHVEDTQLYVSRGIGGAVMPFRINAPPEVTLITLRSLHPDMRRAA
ncbi:MAG TPA: metallophosphoesterase [Myxococcales bacterium]|nr:metallophosphoesterase [Myxococcales bacterium]